MSSKRTQALTKLVQQLEMENSVERVPVSQSGKDLLEYCCENEKFDYLLSKEGPNNFKPERPCPVL